MEGNMNTSRKSRGRLWCLALLAVSAIGMRPALPDRPYTVAWYPRQIPGRPFSGTVLGARANGELLPAPSADGKWLARGAWSPISAST